MLSFEGRFFPHHIKYYLDPFFSLLHELEHSKSLGRFLSDTCRKLFAVFFIAINNKIPIPGGMQRIFILYNLFEMSIIRDVEVSVIPSPLYSFPWTRKYFFRKLLLTNSLKFSSQGDVYSVILPTFLAITIGDNIFITSVFLKGITSKEQTLTGCPANILDLIRILLAISWIKLSIGELIWMLKASKQI